MGRSSRRKDRLSHVVRGVVSDSIANHVADPRVNRFTTVTRVDLSPDLRFADVHVSVMGSDSQARTTLRGLNSARGLIQTDLAKQLEIRHCPIIRFHLDEGVKRAIDTYDRIDALLIDHDSDSSAAGDIHPSSDSGDDSDSGFENEDQG